MVEKPGPATVGVQLNWREQLYSPPTVLQAGAEVTTIQSVLKESDGFLKLNTGGAVQFVLLDLKHSVLDVVDCFIKEERLKFMFKALTGMAVVALHSVTPTVTAAVDSV